MKKIRNKPYTFDDCKNAASNYEFRKDFYNNHPTIYNAAVNKKWIDEICSHMMVVGNKLKRMIYCLEFPNNHAYVGLTYNITKRLKGHYKKGCVSKYMISSGLQPKLINLTDYIDVNEAKELEEFYLEQYKQNGWIMLNTGKTGNTGGDGIIWTKERCLEVVKDCKTRKEFQIKNPSAYGAALRYKFLDEICQHMTPVYVTNRNHEEIFEYVKKYKRKSDFYKNDYALYQYCSNHGILDICCEDMEKRIQWTYSMIIEEACLYSKKIDFYTHSKKAYVAAVNMNIIDEVCKNMETRFLWTDEMIEEELNNYTELNEIHTTRGDLYHAIMRSPNREKFLSKLNRMIHEGYDDKTLLYIASQYDNLTLFRKEQKSVVTILMNRKLYKLAIKNMKRNIVPKGFYTQELIVKLFMTCDTIKEFGIKYPKEYDWARRKEWWKDAKVK